MRAHTRAVGRRALRISTTGRSVVPALLALAVIGEVALGGCSGGETEGTATSIATPDGAPELPRETCLPRPPNAGPGRAADPNGPFSHQVAVGRSEDGVAVRDARVVLEHASVPDGVVASSGEVLVYYVNGEQHGIWVGRLSDGSLVPIAPITIDGVARPEGAVDPDATLLPDGTIRLAYLGSFGPPQPGSGGTWAICLADSKDGVSFTLVGEAIRFTGEPHTDPSLTRLVDGTWLMAISRGQETVIARSPDGLRFEAEQTLGVGGVPEVAALADGRTRLYVCMRGIESHLSMDGGRTWASEGPVVPAHAGKKIICDPSWIAGAGLFVYKVAD